MTMRDHAGNERAVDLPRRRRAPGQGRDDGDLGDGAGGPIGGKEGRGDGKHQRRHDDQPRQGEHGNDVMCALLVVRAVRQPGHQAQREARHSAHGADDDAIRPNHEPDVAICRPHGLEHPEGA